jgi:Proto-chlorophyllide reductase 57 kD subunit
VKFLCIECDEQMRFDERQQPGDGTFAAAFTCGRCGRRIAMLANPFETQLVESLGVKIGGRTLDPEPMEIVRGALLTREGAFVDQPSVSDGRLRPRFSDASQERLARVPSFVRGMVKRLYTEYAVERGISEITPEVMDRARTELGLEGM